MTRSGRVRSRLASGLAVAILLTMFLPGGGMVAPAPARAAATDLTLVTSATYTVRPELGRIQVAVAITVRNRTTESRTRKFYFDHAFLAVQPGATAPTLTGAKGSRARVAKRSKGATLLRLDFGRRLYSGGTTSLRLAFDLSGQGKGASPQVRVGQGLVTVPVWAYASDGASGSSVTVRFPKGWEVAVESGTFGRRTEAPDGSTTLATGALSNPLSFFAFVSAQHPADFVDRPLAVVVGDQQANIVLRAWADDGGWSKRTRALLGRALPALGADIGLDWPHQKPLVVEEAASRDADGYAALFDPTQNRIEVAYWASSQVTIHEAAHAWFNGDLLADRWADEGFASFYGLRAAAVMKVKTSAPTLTAKATAAAVPLNAWVAGDPGGEARDAYGYATSLALAKAIAKRVGLPALTAAWTDAADRIGAYQPPLMGPGASSEPDAAAGSGASTAPGVTPELVDGPPDWRGLLDLLEARSGKDLTDLWREFVLRPAELPLVDARGATRSSYQRTLALAGDWTLPRSIRDALRAWQFDAAEALLADARTVIAQRNALVAQAARDGVVIPGSTRVLFEAGSFAAASERAEADREALATIEGSSAARSADDDILSRIGMLGEHPEADLETARTAFGHGDLVATLDAADRAHRAWTAAWEEGRRRLLLGLAVLATIVVLVSAVGRTLRRTRRSALRQAHPTGRPADHEG